jgi:hypothetical protein
MQTQLSSEQIKDIIIHDLPEMMKADPKIRRFVLKITKEKYADKEKTEDRIDRILDELRRNREEDSKKWDENRKKWEAREIQRDKDREEERKRWDEQNQKWHENQKTIHQIIKKHESSIGALGARWGMRSEASFRDGLKAILEQSFKVKVERYEDFDDKGIIFGRPDQVEMDVIVYNGTLILCEIKSSLSRSDLYTFWRKTLFYEDRHQRKADRRIVISPMVSQKAMTVAKELNIEVYGYPDDVPITC